LQLRKACADATPSLSVTLEVQKCIPDLINVDVSRVTQILAIAVSNGMKVLC
jgi:hypothetical protein